MKTLRRIGFFFVSSLLLILQACHPDDKPATPATYALYSEPHRPQFHFSPREQWMNDPNGMVYHKGVYHLFYQHYPDSNVWGPMHWGHATSKDLVHWTQLPIALYPDSLGMIFSGSAVVDTANTSGLGSKENPPMVAIFTYHAAEKEKAGRIDYQTQGLAYSLDDGMTWKKYDQNPVLKNPGIKDFRDPKVFWFAQGKQWIMTLAVQDHIEFYGSPDLLSWTKLGEFGKDKGHHGGVWECPDLFELQVEGTDQTRWVLLVSINPGGPNGGSATQYFVGDFTGKDFLIKHNWLDTLWVDYGPDNYAGVTFSNAPDNRRIFMGWMNNWAYGDVVPTQKWRGATTVPRELSLREKGLKRYLISRPVSELVEFGSIDQKDVAARKKAKDQPELSIITGEFNTETFDYIEYSNSNGEKLRIGWERDGNYFYIDRSDAGNITFSPNFPTRVRCPRLGKGVMIPYTIVTDVSSVEAFFDDGMTSMTATFFTEKPLTNVMTYGTGDIRRTSTSEVTYLKKIW